MNAEELSPDQALQEIGRVDQRVRHSARGGGWMFLIMGVATVAYWPAMFLGRGLVPLAGGVGWVALTIALCVYCTRRRVHDRLFNRTSRSVTAAYAVTTFLVFVFGTFLMPERPSPGWITTLVAISLIAGLPPMYAGWRILGKG
ncbi:hypothetical protein [Planotetraspora sp. GP83]|uniref:hypothetical protein n=1 Tax=Planotetraspora sp. GP83 TaxID=3156264 RepID=UPI00351893AF